MTAEQTQPPTILIVDDDLPIVNLCKTFLEEAGFTVLGTDGSSEALKICTQHEGPIDLLLTDRARAQVGLFWGGEDQRRG